MKPDTPWIGVDLDGTLAHHDKWGGLLHIGEPVESMVNLVKTLISADTRVKVFTARVSPVGHDEASLRLTRRAIKNWCRKHLGKQLEVTHEKDMYMQVLFDDRAVAVKKNTGECTGWVGGKVYNTHELP